ncbi:dihydrofolate reductase family protein [Atopococcus tabaci]|uniref:dihydrofolate reductase family protein n=1 Tax=Atopococcus tabaci TaxID=269774 RepID=UPI000409CD95|nr:dihydrofolate reductase family protein [Atopococcus tabaci]
MSKKRKVVLFIAASLDGYIATEDESLEWLFRVEGEGDNGTLEFYDSIDTLVMGRRTYEWIIHNEPGEFPYKDKQCYVFTRSPMENTEDVTFVNEDVTQFVEKLRQQDGGDIWMVGGGDLLKSFLEARLIDEITVTVAPVLLGKGIPLFKEGEYETELVLKRVRNFNQFAELKYELKKDKT